MALIVLGVFNPGGAKGLKTSIARVGPEVRTSQKALTATHLPHISLDSQLQECQMCFPKNSCRKSGMGQ